MLLSKQQDLEGTQVSQRCSDLRGRPTRVGPAVVSILGSIVEIMAKRLSSTSSDLESNIARSYTFGVNELFLINEIRQDTFILACI